MIQGGIKRGFRPLIRYRYETPIREELAQELFAFWEEVFGPEDPDIPIGVFLGEESDHNRHVVHAERDDGVLVGTCGILTPRANPEFAGIGEVATRPEYRGQGIANRLCRQALDELAEQGGEVVFLGTENPAAARIYHRLGWRRIAGSTVYANVVNGTSPEEYLVDYFRTPSLVNIVAGDASLRVPMIPLLLTPHDWQVLDGNLPTPMVSTRYAMLNSCMGLCRKYYYLVKRDDAEWFAAKTSDGRLVGIATAFIDAENICHVDGFIHKRFSDSYHALITEAVHWGQQRDSTGFVAGLSVEDEEKRAEFEGLGFVPSPSPLQGEIKWGCMNGVFTVGDREVEVLAMILD